MAYLRGAFLAGGSVTDPAKRYHLEMTTSHYKVSRETCALLLDAGLVRARREDNRIYYDLERETLAELFATAQRILLSE